MKKYIIIAAGVIVVITTVFVIIRIRSNKQKQTDAQKWEQLTDSAAAQRLKVISDSINLIEAKKKLNELETERDTLYKDMVGDSFAMDVRRRVQRARIESNHAKLVRDSLGRLGTGAGNH